MKRLVPIFLCILLVAALTVPAYAAGKTSFSMSASDSSLHRGDTVTFTVSVAAGEPATSYGFMLSYDNSAFELVNGSCTVSGTLVSSFKNGFAFMFQTATAYSGTVGTVTFKVKDNASYGNYTITGTASVKNGTNAVSASGASGKLTVACDHNYGNWSADGESSHQRTCSNCKKVETANHSWGNSVVIKQPNCVETGSVRYTCSDCNATKTEGIEESGRHSFGHWTNQDEKYHVRRCKFCQEKENAEHIWVQGMVNLQPNCKEFGKKTWNCRECGATKIETISKTTDHKYGAWIPVNDNTHKHICSFCSGEETANHSWNSGSITKKATCKEEGIKTFTCTGCSATKTEAVGKLTTHAYDNACDTNCNVCDTTRAVTHKYKSVWNKDQDGHWRECAVCHEKAQVAAHIPGAEATEIKAQTCKACGYVIKAALSHTHKYASKWSADERKHWYACEGCEEKKSSAAHSFANNCDPECSVCGYTREIQHDFEDSWISDASTHWKICAGCGLKQNASDHEPGPEATADSAQICTICSYEIAPALNVPEPTIEETELLCDEEVTPVVEEKKDFPWWGVAAAVAVIVAVAALLLRKKS